MPQLQLIDAQAALGFVLAQRVLGVVHRSRREPQDHRLGVPERALRVVAQVGVFFPDAMRFFKSVQGQQQRLGRDVGGDVQEIFHDDQPCCR